MTDSKPPSVRLVERVLNEIGPATLSEVVDESGLPRSTARWALRRLRTRGTIESWPRPGDARERLYARNDRT